MLRQQLTDYWKVQHSTPVHLSIGMFSNTCLVIARQTPMLEELSGPSKSLIVSSGSAIG